MNEYKYSLDKNDVDYLFWENPFFRNTSYNRTATRKTMFIVLLIPIFIFGFGLIFSLIRRDLFENYQVIGYLFLSVSLLIVIYVSRLGDFDESDETRSRNS